MASWLGYSYNREQDAESSKLLAGFTRKNPSAILEVNGFDAHFMNSKDSRLYNEDDEKQNPERLEEMIFTFLLTRCPVGEQFRKYTSLEWADEAPSRRAMWTKLGIFPRDCSASSKSGVSAERACAGRNSEEQCKAVGCCAWGGAQAAEGCHVKEGLEKDAQCSGEGPVE